MRLRRWASNILVHIIVLTRLRSFFARGMAWRCSSDTNEGLCQNLRTAKVIKSDAVYNAMLATDRMHYLGRYSNGADAYQDSPQYIGHAATISAPHMHAAALEVLLDKLKPGSNVLDIGCGSGYLTAVIKRMVGTEGKVVGIDYLKELVDMSRENILKDDKSFLEGPNAIKLETRDGWQGAEEHGPFDAIHVGAAAKVMPKKLIEQLAPNGKMVIPVGPEGEHQTLYLVEKNANGVDYTTKTLMGVVFVPLVDREGDSWTPYVR